MVERLVKLAIPAPLPPPDSFEEVPGQILSAYETAGHTLNEDERQQMINAWLNLDVVKPDLGRKIDGFSQLCPAAGTYAQWIPRLSEIMRKAADRVPKSRRGFDKNAAQMYRACYLIMALSPIMMIHEILAITGVGETYYNDVELPSFVPYTIPRNSEEAKGLIESLEQSDDRVYSSMLMAILVRRHATVGSRQHAGIDPDITLLQRFNQTFGLF